MQKNKIKNKHTYIYILFQQGFYSHYPHIKPQFTLMDYLVLLSYLSPLFFKIKPFVGLSYVLLNYSELSSYPMFLLIHDAKIKNIGYI